MNFELENFDLSTVAREKSEALLVILTSAFVPGKDVLSALIAKALKAGDLQAKPARVLDIYRPLGLGAARLLLVHAGDGTHAQLRQAVAGAMALLKPAQTRQLRLHFAQCPSETGLRVAMTALADASYVYTSTKSQADGRSLQRVRISGVTDKALRGAFECAAAAVNGIELAKEWGNRPANHATPTQLAKAAQALAKWPHVRCQVLGPKEVAKLGMGAFQAVAQGSDEPLRFIVLHYDGAARSQAPTVLVGKGITFDSGGISLKPAPEMDEMKFDMCGAASVLGVFRALAELQPAINVVGLIPACENLPGPRALKPGDVITSMSGQTIEVLNTDAEGRLVLCDALSYAERFKPRAVLDIATLTGACVIALGAVRSGFFSSDAELAAALAKASESSQDLCWPMPLDDEYAEGLKSAFADVANVAGRQAGAVTAAKFLQRFTAKYPWGHLDIAGTAWKSGQAKGATGRPVGLLLDYLLAQANSKAPKAGQAK